MGYFYDTYLGYRRKQWLRSIYSVQVLVGSTWYTGTIDSKKISDDSLIFFVTFPDLNDTACTITASRLIDVRGEVAAYQQRTITKVAGQGTLIKITIPIYEVTS